MRECKLYLARRGTLGEYEDITEIFAHTFEILVDRLACTHKLLDQTDIFAANSVPIVMEKINK